MSNSAYMYLRRCTDSKCTDTQKTLHGALGESYTLCGREINDLWWIESSLLYTDEDISCKNRRKEMEVLNNV